MPRQDECVASVFFLARNDMYGTEKPYSLTPSARDRTTDSLPATSVALTHKDIRVKDLRDIEKTFAFNRSGFAVIDMTTAMSYEDFDDPKALRRVYQAEIAHMLFQYLEATEVHVFNHRVSSSSR